MPATTLNPLPSLIRASARDAADERMRAAGRKTWSVGDYNAMVRTQDRLIDACYGKGPEGRAKFGFAAVMEQQGLLSLRTKDFFGTLNAAWDEYLASFAEAA